MTSTKPPMTEELSMDEVVKLAKSAARKFRPSGAVGREDLEQEAALHILHKDKNLRGEKPRNKALLHKAGVNGISQLLRRNNEDVEMTDEGEMVEDTQQEGPSDAVEAQEQRLLLSEALDTLPDDEALAVKSYYGLEGEQQLPLEGVAGRLGLSKQGASGVVGRGLDKISNFLLDEAGNDR